MKKFRFVDDEGNSRWVVKAKHKTTGKWEIIGFCHYSARGFIERGERITELLRLTIKNN